MISELLPPSDIEKLLHTRAIQITVADYFGIETEDLVSQKRTKELVQPRQIAMYMCREKLTQLSYSNIAQAFNREDHTTVLHACRQIEKIIEENGEDRQVIILLLDQFR